MTSSGSFGARFKKMTFIIRRYFSHSKAALAPIRKVAVVGLGLMGHGVAQVTAQAGYQVLGIESQQQALDVGTKRIEGSLGKMIAKDVQKGKIASETEGKKMYDQVFSRLSFSTKLADAADCDLIIEVIFSWLVK